MKIYILLLGYFILSACHTTSTSQSSIDIENIACHSDHSFEINNNPLPSWHISNLYDCQSKQLFIPYQLWSGEKWDGQKFSQDKDSCFHHADTLFYVDGESATTIKGPTTWLNPKTNKNSSIWVRDKLDEAKTQYFTCHEKGIGRVYDSRNGGRYYKEGRCKFPAGYGWQIGKKRWCLDTAIQITKFELDAQNNLSAIEFKWWYKNSQRNYVHDHNYRYAPNIGSVNAWKQ